MKIYRFAYGVAAIALLGFGATPAQANSRAGVGTTGPGSPSCSSFGITLTGGAIVEDATNQCTETDVNATSIEVIADQTDPLSIYSPLLQAPTVDDGNLSTAEAAVLNTLAWTEVCAADGATQYECTLTAPTETAADQLVLAPLVKAGIIDDGDCDSDDTIFFVPAGCDLFFTTGAIGNNPLNAADPSTLLFADGETVTSQSFGVPEPGTVTLLLAGMLGVFALRRKYAL